MISLGVFSLYDSEEGAGCEQVGVEDRSTEIYIDRPIDRYIEIYRYKEIEIDRGANKTIVRSIQRNTSTDSNTGMNK